MPVVSCGSTSFRKSGYRPASYGSGNGQRPKVTTLASLKKKEIEQLYRRAGGHLDAAAQSAASRGGSFDVIAHGVRQASRLFNPLDSHAHKQRPDGTWAPILSYDHTAEAAGGPSSSASGSRPAFSLGSGGGVAARGDPRHTLNAAAERQRRLEACEARQTIASSQGEDETAGMRGREQDYRGSGAVASGDMPASRAGSSSSGKKRLQQGGSNTMERSRPSRKRKVADDDDSSDDERAALASKRGKDAHRLPIPSFLSGLGDSLHKELLADGEYSSDLLDVQGTGLVQPTMSVQAENTAKRVLAGAALEAAGTDGRSRDAKVRIKRPARIPSDPRAVIDQYAPKAPTAASVAASALPRGPAGQPAAAVQRAPSMAAQPSRARGVVIDVPDDDDDFRAFVVKLVNGEEYDEHDWRLFLVMCENGEHELLADAAEMISADQYGAALQKYAGVTEKYVLLAISFAVQQLPKEERGDLLWRALSSSRHCSSVRWFQLEAEKNTAESMEAVQRHFETLINSVKISEPKKVA